LPVDKIWYDKSYQDRFTIFCERLMAEGLYDSVCYIASSAADPTPIELSPRLDWRHFSSGIEARIAFLKGVGVPAGSGTLDIDISS
jgi:hypothetical protein